MNAIKRLRIEQHNRKYEQAQQYKLAYEIMDIERLETRDYLEVRERDKRSRAKAMQLMILTSALAHTR